ncbi:hypothetical protein P9112_007644 [Eukaryota sp. TZLM1-RC]
MNLSVPPCIAAGSDLLLQFTHAKPCTSLFDDVHVKTVLLSQVIDLELKVHKMHTIIHTLNLQEHDLSLFHTDSGAQQLIDHLESLFDDLASFIKLKPSITMWLQKSLEDGVINLPKAVRFQMRELLFFSSEMVENAPELKNFLTLNNYFSKLSSFRTNAKSLLSRILLILSTMEHLCDLLNQYCAV